MRLNKAKKKPNTHEGAKAVILDGYRQLRRTVSACLLWENQFYEDGVSIADRIKTLCASVEPSKVADLAIEARYDFKLRHVPLLLARELVRRKDARHLVADLLANIIGRPDEITEFMAMYWQDGKTPIAACVKRGLGDAFNKFSEYQLAKYNRKREITLKDAMLLIHPRPKDVAQSDIFGKLLDDKLAVPDTWEVGLSQCKSDEEKREVWERLIDEKKLGGLAVLRNIRNMHLVDVPPKKIAGAIEDMNASRVLPFRFVAAASYTQSSIVLDALEKKLFSCCFDMPKLPGKTIIVVDNSGSMYQTKVSAKSDMERIHAACALAMIAREICEECMIVAFSTFHRVVAPHRGFPLGDTIMRATDHNATYLGKTVSDMNKVEHDRIIVITDDRVPDPYAKDAYIINVASYENGVGYGAWTHIDGFSENVFRFINESERSE